MDLSMPVLDGFEATKRIREIEARMEWPPAKIVALSAYGTDESRSKAIECGCDLFLMKPASPRKIRETVQLLLK
jgi:CheY-like chemotaxis protein